MNPYRLSGAIQVTENARHVPRRTALVQETALALKGVHLLANEYPHGLVDVALYHQVGRV